MTHCHVVGDEVKRLCLQVGISQSVSSSLCHIVGDEVKRLCLQVGISQSASSSTATLFVSSWLTPPLLRTLKVRLSGRDCMHKKEGG